MKIQLIVLMCFIGLLTGCASGTMKAPCDYQGHFCGAKTKINTW